MPHPAKPLSDLPPIVMPVDETGRSVPLYAPRLPSPYWTSVTMTPADRILLTPGYIDASG